jgi:DNA helicase II / ATP-dependent DNA helicase PcrA
MFDLDNLNPEQQQAVAHNHGPLLILAGAGSGKTRVLVSRVARLMAEAPANEPAPGMCVLTFTNKAAKELKHRVKEQIGSKTSSLWAGTFHSFGLQILRKYARRLDLNPKFHVADTTDCSGIIKDLLINMTNTGKNNFAVDKLLTMVQAMAQGPLNESLYDEDYLSVAEMLVPKYESRKRALGVVDFEDLLSKPLELFEQDQEILEKVQHTFRYFMVDEFQDTNDTQMKLLNILVRPLNNIVVVGDDDQAIYGWRGARVKNILEFPKIFADAKVIQLNRNYRSSGAILDLANNVIEKNKDRHGKVLKAQLHKEGAQMPEVFVFDDDTQEVEQVARLIAEVQSQGYAFKDVAVLYRSNGQGGYLETELRQARIPYKISGGSAFFDRKEVKDMLAYLVCIALPKEVSLRRVINVPQRGIGDETLKKLEEYILQQSEPMSFIKALRESQNFEFLSSGGRQGIKKFLEDLQDLKQVIIERPSGQWEQDLIRYFHRIGYREYLSKYCKNDEGLKKRWASVEIFARVFSNFMAKKRDSKKGLREFVDMMLLRDYEDELESEEKDQVQLMTMHAAKGLEFPVVFVIGVEEDLIPHHRLGSDISEERRLFYVGVTRAQESLIITRARLRKRQGKMREVLASRFLEEVNSSLYRLYEGGYRPVNEQQKTSMIDELKARLAESIERQRIT